MVKIEPPGGERCRHVGPFLDDIPHPERSLSFWYYNTSKRGITLNLETADGRRLFARLAATSDVILETFRPGFLASLGLGHASLRGQNDGLIMCSLTPFGQTGPWRDYLSTDLLQCGGRRDGLLRLRTYPRAFSASSCSGVSFGSAAPSPVCMSAASWGSSERR